LCIKDCLFCVSYGIRLVCHCDIFYADFAAEAYIFSVSISEVTLITVKKSIRFQVFIAV
jgi:hypothetical protein